MTRRLRAFAGLTAMLSSAAVVFVPTPASAATAITGQLRDENNTTITVSGMTVELWSISGGNPDKILVTDVTSSTGNFTLDPGTSAGTYFVHVDAGKWQGGWVGEVGGRTYAQNGQDAATRYAAGTALGNVFDYARFIRGVVVDSGTGNPVAGVYMTGRSSTDPTAVDAADHTNSRGAFYVFPTDCEDDCILRANGLSLSPSYENGPVNTGTHQVVDNWGDATAAGPGAVGKVKIDKCSYAGASNCP